VVCDCIFVYVVCDCKDFCIRFVIVEIVMLFL
jgi:hypothetical protein